MTRPIGARDLIEQAVDRGSFVSWDHPPDRSGISGAYAEQLARAAERAGVDEAVITGEALIRGRRVAVAACEFGFLAGSMGVAAARRLARAVERATAERIPLLASPASGGTRMQEGTVAFVEMVRISAAIARHKAQGLAYLVYLRNPTTGGVLASWGSLGHVTVAESGALIGFLGPRVFQALYGREFPAGVQTAENLFARGLVDAVVSATEVPDVVDRALSVLTADPPAPVPDPAEGAPTAGAVDAWEAVQRSRSADRPGVRRFLRTAAEEVLPLNGTGQGETDPGLLLALARFDGAPCVLLGQDRRGQTAMAPLGPGALRVARRGMRLAEELRLPLVTVVDTPGAALSPEAEEGGLAGEIARSLADLVTLEAASVTVLLGQGSGGGALALLPANRVIATQHAWLSPLPPEGAAAIMHRDAGRAPEMARMQGIGAAELLRHGIVDRVVPELPDAATEPDAFCRRLGAALRHELGELARHSTPTLVAQRMQRYGG